jgi:hypothetical protein
MKNRIDWIIFVLVFAVWASAAGPDRVHAQGEPAGETSITNKLSGEFDSFLGEDNSTNVVTGLRNGSSFEYTDSTGTTVTIEPPAGKMGSGEVNHSLRLAEYQLTQDGITDPTAAQFQEALTGEGGILTLRESGLGWGQTFREMDTTLGAIISKGKAAQQGLDSGKVFSAGFSPGESTGGVSTSTSESGIVTGGGNSSENGFVTGSGSSSGDGYGKGIFSGSGKAYGYSSGGVYGSSFGGSGRSFGSSGGSRSFGSGGGGRSFGGTRGRGR